MRAKLTEIGPKDSARKVGQNNTPNHQLHAHNSKENNQRITKQHKYNFSAGFPAGEPLGENPTPKVYARPFSTLKHRTS